MSARHRAGTAGLVVLTGALGWAAVLAAPAGTHAAGMWPVGLASALLLRASHRARPGLLLVLLAVAFATLLAGGYPTGVAAGYAVGLALGALVTQRVLGSGPRARRLVDDQDLVRFAASAVLGATTAALVFAATSALTGFGVAWMVGLGVFVTHLVSHLVVVAFFMEELRTTVPSTPFERSLRWGSAVSATVVAFVPLHLPSMLFLVIPLIGWTALRAPMREALWLLLAVAGISSTMTALGRGPFIDMDSIRGRAPELSVLPLQGYLLGCALISIPFAMVVARQWRSSSEAANERERLSRIVEGATAMAIIETDLDGRITLFNPGARLILGYSEEEVLGRSAQLFHSREEITRQAALLGVPDHPWQVAMESARPQHGPRDWQFVRRDGEQRTLSMSMTSIDDAGTCVGYLCTAEDITERARTQEALEAALRTERRAVAHLTEVDKSKDAFVSSVSHELRTPITNIVGYLELLLDGAYGDTTPPQHQALARIDGNSQRLLELIDDLLTLSSVESLDVELDPEPVDLRSVVRRAAGGVRGEASQRGQQVDVQVPDGPVVVLGDEDHLERMVANLATNAVKFTPLGGRITLRVRQDAPGQGHAIEVEDTGVGIPDEEQALLFNRFYRCSYAETEAIKGSGLGLSIARSIAQRHGARIGATSTPGVGSVFTVSFEDRTADAACPI